MKLTALRLLFLFICIALHPCLFARVTFVATHYNKSNGISGALSGTVTEKNGHRPLAKATIYIPDLHAGAVADDNGRYNFNLLPNGTYIVEARYIGYKTVVKNIFM